MRFIGRRLNAVSFVLSLLPLGIASAHHSTAEFDYSKELTIHGKVKAVQWTNPHSYIQLLVPGDDGQQVEWSVEIGSPSLNIKLGWRKNSVVAGDEVTMLLSPARNGTPYGTLRVLTFADGRELKGVAAQVGSRPAPAPVQSQ
ncbi:MAG TPA: DUF6152 family protein [Gammaproteobacteria bacterium]